LKKEVKGILKAINQLIILKALKGRNNSAQGKRSATLGKETTRKPPQLQTQLKIERHMRRNKDK